MTSLYASILREDRATPKHAASHTGSASIGRDMPPTRLPTYRNEGRVTACPQNARQQPTRIKTVRGIFGALALDAPISPTSSAPAVTPPPPPQLMLVHRSTAKLQLKASQEENESAYAIDGFRANERVYR